MTDTTTKPARHMALWDNPTENAALWRLAYRGPDFDAEVQRIAQEFGRTTGAVVREYNSQVWPSQAILDKVPTAVLARIVADRLAR